MKRYTVRIEISFESADARTLELLIKDPMVRATLEAQGVRMAGDAVVFQPSVRIDVPIDATGFPEAFNHTRLIESLIRQPFLRTAVEAQGVRVPENGIVVYQPKEQEE